MKAHQQKTTSSLKFIGKLYSRVVGCQYYTADAKLGEILNFDRNPANEFDKNAIEANFYRDCNQFSSATVLKMAERFKTLTRDNVLPRSILLSRLLHWKAQELLNSETSQFHQLIMNYLKKLRPAPCLAYSNLESLVPPVKAPGVGFDVGIDGKDIAGAACLDGGRLIYLSAFVEKSSGRDKGRIYNHVDENDIEI